VLRRPGLDNGTRAFRLRGLPKKDEDHAVSRSVAARCSKKNFKEW
jgi:hypothetical protein